MEKMMEESQVVLDGFRRYNETRMSKEELDLHLDELREFLTLKEEVCTDGNHDVKGAPLFDVISLWLEIKNDQTIDGDVDTPREIFGVLKLSDENGGDHCFYDRPREDPVKILPKRNSDGTLSLHLPIGDHDGPMGSFFPGFELSASFSDKAQDHVLIETTFRMDYTNFDDFDRVLYKPVEGQYANLYLKHIVYRAAVYALVEFKLWKKADEGSTDGALAVRSDDLDKNGMAVTVSGSVYASCHHNCSSFLAHSHDEPDCHCIPMFGFPNASVEMTLGTSMKLLRPLVSVPAYSSLVIGANLQISGIGVVNDIVEFPAHDYNKVVKTIEGTNGLVCQVTVDWEHGFYTLDQIYAPNHSSESIKRHKANDSQQGSQSFRLYKHPCNWTLYGDKLMEVFSVFVVLNKDEIHNIHGTIDVTHILGDFRIYDKDENNGDLFSCSKLLPVKGPYDTCFTSSPLIMKVDLKAGGQQFCKGYFEWDECSVRSPWFDKYICSVIKGDQGYTAVNYAIFSCAVQAKILVFISVPCDHVGVSGRIVSEYNENDSKCRYYRQYFQSFLFSTAEDSPVELLGSHEVPIPISDEMQTSPSDGVSGPSLPSKVSAVPLPLSKSVVCVPFDSSLVINLNLKVKTSKFEDVAFSSRVEFVIGDDSCCVIENQGYEVYVLVAWGCFIRPPQLEISS